MPDLMTGLLTTVLFLGALSGLLFLLAWLERPLRRPRGSAYAPSHRGTRSPS